MLLNSSIKPIICTLLLTFLSVHAVVPSPKPLEYSAIVNRCFSTYKRCALGSVGGCKRCELACGDQEILRDNLKFATVCTLLRDYCKDKETASPDDTCTESTCLTYNKQCRQNGLDDVSCRYCASACRSCPREYKQCRPNQPVPSPLPGCQIGACTYYSNLCRISQGLDICQFCDATCSSLCDDEADVCKQFFPRFEIA